MFDTHILDAASLAAEGYVLISEDMYFRQWVQAATSSKGVWLHTVFAFAHETGKIDDKRLAALLVKLAWRRHGHLAIDVQSLLDAFDADSRHIFIRRRYDGIHAVLRWIWCHAGMRKSCRSTVRSRCLYRYSSGHGAFGIHRKRSSA